MKIDRVIFSWDGNPLYNGFFELQQKLWACFGTATTLMYIGDDDSKTTAKDIVVLEPNNKLPKGIHPERNWQATMPLLFGPRLFPEETIMTSGLDQFPLSRKFQEAVDDLPEDAFVIGFAGIDGYIAMKDTAGCRYYPSSHMVAKGSVWSDALHGSPDTFPDFLEWAWKQDWPIMWPDFAIGWGIDEAVISQMLHRNKNVRTIPLSKQFFNDWNSARCGRCCQVCDPERVSSGIYTELHCYVPISQEELHVINRCINELQTKPGT